MNPTGSFKDRGVAYLASKLLEEGVSRVIIDSSGNAAVSTAAYCSRAGISHMAVMPVYSHREKKAEVLWHGSRIIETPDRDSARKYARRIAEELDIRYIGFALEPNAVPGFETVVYEIEEETHPDAVFVPTGSGTNIVAIGRAYLELERRGEIEGVPQIHCVQSAACAPIAGEFVEYTPIESTLAEGVIVPHTERKTEAVKLVERTGGTGWVVDDDEVYRAMELLAMNGIYASPTGAVAVAGALKAGWRGRKVVCIVTGSGLKSNLMPRGCEERIIGIESDEKLDRLLLEDIRFDA
jgi:threonine synthase